MNHDVPHPIVATRSPGRREVARDVVEATDDTLPVIRLGGDLLGEVGGVRHGGSRRLEGGRLTPEEG